MGDSCWRPTKCIHHHLRFITIITATPVVVVPNYPTMPAKVQLLHGDGDNSWRDGNWTTIQRSILSYLFQTNQCCHQKPSYPCLGSIKAATRGDSCWKPTQYSSFAVSAITLGRTGIGPPFKGQSCRTSSKLANGVIKSQANHGWGQSQRRPEGTLAGGPPNATLSR